jgi:hypothetical protein
MSLRTAFKTSDDITSGRWFTFDSLPNDDKSIPAFKLGYMSNTNPAYQAAMERVSKELRRDIELDILTENTAGPVMRGVFVDTILMDWRNVQTDGGDNIPFSKEAATAFFAELPELYLTLVGEAKKLANFRAESKEAVAKKSVPPSKAS